MIDEFAAQTREIELKIDHKFGALKPDITDHLTQAMEAKTDQIGGKLDQLRDETREGFTRREAEVFNKQMRRDHAASMKIMDPKPLRSIRKVNPGRGCHLPGQDSIPDLPELRVGELVPSGYFPATRDELISWSDHQFNALSILLNDSFRIKPGDDRFRRWYHLLVFLTE